MSPFFNTAHRTASYTFNSPIIMSNECPITPRKRPFEPEQHKETPTRAYI